MDPSPRSQARIQTRRWDSLSAVLPVRKLPWLRRERKGGRPPQDDALCWQAILWRLRSGKPWRTLPGCFGSSRTIQRRIAQWRDRGILDALWSRCLERLSAAERRGWREAIDAAPGRSRGVWYWEMLGKLLASTAAERRALQAAGVEPEGSNGPESGEPQESRGFTLAAYGRCAGPGLSSSLESPLSREGI